MRYPIYFARATYSVSWFSFAPALIYISRQFNLDIIQLGILGSAFYLGLIPSQLIGGMLAFRTGPKLITVSGLIGISAASLAISFSSDFGQLLALRAMTGISASLFSSPALALLTSRDDDRIGMKVGVYNSMFNLGAAATLVSFVVADETLGWRFTFILTAALNLFSAVLILFTVPEIRGNRVGRSVTRGIFYAFRNKILFNLSLSALIASIIESIIGQFLVFYLENYFDFTPYISGLLNAIYWFVGIFGGFAVGWYFYRSGHKRSLYIGGLMLMLVLITLLPFLRSLYFVAAILSGVGVLVNWTLSILYYLVLRNASDQYEAALFLGYNNFLQKLMASAFPFLFMLVESLGGYTAPWVFIGSFGAALLAACVAVPSGIRSMQRNINTER
ncbi:MAG: MFS transporter [Thermoplasmataceae archaeon]